MSAQRDPAGDRDGRDSESASARRPEPTDRELHAMWSLHRLQTPTFDDLTRGLCLGLVWCMALWTPMFLSALI